MKLFARSEISLLLSASLLVTATVPGFAQSVPIPVDRPAKTDRITTGSTTLAQGSNSAVDPWRFGREVTAPANPLINRTASSALPVTAGAFAASLAAGGARAEAVRPIRGELKEGLQALSDRNESKARAIREGMRRGSLDHKILAWAIALSGASNVPSYEIAAASAELAGWPGMKTLRENSEKALWREKQPPANVIRAFSAGAPESPEGKMALARAYLQTGDGARARALISAMWREETLDRSMESAVLSNFSQVLTRDDHRHRMAALLYRDRISDADRVRNLAEASSLFRAWSAAIRGESNAGALLNQVPSDQRATGYQFALVEHMRKSGRVSDAANLLLRAPKDPRVLINPDAWWNERRIIARDLLDLGNPKLAYQVAAGHTAQDDVERAEAEFHCGWIALRFLGDARTAHAHFANILKVSSKPISLSRGYYWLGRAAEAGGGGNARGYFAEAAKHSTTFYGQLAMARLGNSPRQIAYPNPSGSERQRFESREAVQAIHRLEGIGSDWRADILYRDLARELDSPGELALLAVMAERRGNHNLSLTVGKLASYRGVDAPALAYPIGVIPASANISSAGKALAYSIARQESAFNPKARSGAGALGLLQLMPGTARAVAGRMGLPYSEGRLLADPGYNATLGARFLGEQISDFGGSYVLTFAAYNAGPRRAKQWIERFGDPRGKSIDEVVDWIERIPFGETRSYVQRIMENYQIYKIRLGAPFSIEQDLRFGRRS
ncbi:lytic transglycosylase domain-containing protein [Fulvimarina endophytica]|uniref:Lytic transglycosylase domain-containing protein n=1 Tax=Fulvimarina endophytica TaxID=2293836 RepID=A0A371X9W5_9HYPH|nr:lytic transglycosylase domain-containing protein [Fulvimarina endophytica]RFC66023.1 lytic transglycosylase domain-containing protein [Fulvimarina endophytica]